MDPIVEKGTIWGFYFLVLPSLGRMRVVRLEAIGSPAESGDDEEEEQEEEEEAGRV